LFPEIHIYSQNLPLPIRMLQKPWENDDTFIQKVKQKNNEWKILALTEVKQKFLSLKKNPDM